MNRLPAAYRGDGPYVFVCWAHADAAVVLPEIEWLRSHGVNVWYDEGISPGAEWREELGDAIRNCRMFLFFVSPAAIASPNCRRELNFALDDHRPTLAIHLEEATLSDGLRLSLSDRQAIFRYLETEDGYRDKLAASIDRALDAALPEIEAKVSRAPVAAARRRRRLWSRAAMVTAAAAMLTIAWYAGTRTIPVQPGREITSFEIGPVTSYNPLGHSLAISDDGRHLLYNDSGVKYVRSLDALDAVALGSVEDPFFSPDGAWIAGMGGSGLVRVPRTGGAQLKITSANSGSYRFFGGTWGDSGTIVWADNHGIFRITRDASEPELLVAPDASAAELAYAAPQLLPRNRALLFTIAFADSVDIAVLDMQTRAKRVLLPAAFNAQYVEGGYLVFAKLNGLYAVRFDPASLSVAGEPVPLDIRPALSKAGAEYAVSRNGTLAYLPARSEDQGAPPTLSWVDRAGREEPVGAPAAGWVYPRVSPDGRYIVADVFGAHAHRNLQVWDLQRRNMTPLTDTATENIMPLWSSDGRVVYFASERDGTFDIFAVPSDGSGTARLIFGTDLFEAPLVLTNGDAKLVILAQTDLRQIDLAHPDSMTPFLVTPYNEGSLSLSPDGRWFAYQSDDSGKNEIYVRPFEEPERRRWKVSIDGGRAPVWSRHSDEIFFRGLTGDMMAASYVTEPEFDIKDTVTLFAGAPYENTVAGSRDYDVSPTDGRFLMVKTGKQPEGPTDRIVVVVNWSEALKKLLPEGS